MWITLSVPTITTLKDLHNPGKHTHQQSLVWTHGYEQ